MPIPTWAKATDYGSLLDLDAQAEQNRQAREAKGAEMSRDFSLKDWLTSADPYATAIKGAYMNLGDRYSPESFPGRVVSGLETGANVAKNYLADSLSGQAALDYREEQIKDKQRIAALPEDLRGTATAESAINTALDWGGAGVMAGKMAKGANLKALTQAKTMKSGGATNEETFSRTGWREMAPDEWSFEIPDTGFKARKDMPKSPKIVGDVFEHPKLFDAYPELADTPLALGDIGTASGQYMPKRAGKDFGITLNPKGADPSSAALHEIQHGVQDIEGQVGGASTNMADNYRRLAINDLDAQIAEKTGGPLSTKRQELAEADPLKMYERDWGEAVARMTQDRYEMARDMRDAGVPEDDIDDALIDTPLKLDKPEGSLIDVYGNYQKLMDDERIPLGSMSEGVSPTEFDEKNRQNKEL